MKTAMGYLKIGALTLLVIAGCKVGPNYRTPDMSVPGKFGEATTRSARGSGA